MNFNAQAIRDILQDPKHYQELKNWSAGAAFIKICPFTTRFLPPESTCLQLCFKAFPDCITEKAKYCPCTYYSIDEMKRFVKAILVRVPDPNAPEPIKEENIIQPKNIKIKRK